MQTLYHDKLFLWFSEHPRLPPSSTAEESLFNTTYPLRPMVGRFHRMATVLLIILVTVLIVQWFMMHIIYPQPQPHTDDLSGYEAILPGEAVNPEDYSFRLIPRTSRPEEINLDKAETNTYINSSNMPQVIIIDITYQQEKIVRFTLYSNAIQLHDLLWRWGRPDYKQKDITARHWDLGWYKNHYIVSMFVHSLNLNTVVEIVWIAIR